MTIKVKLFYEPVLNLIFIPVRKEEVLEAEVAHQAVFVVAAVFKEKTRVLCIKSGLK